MKGALFSELGVGVGELEDRVGTQSFPVWGKTECVPVAIETRHLFLTTWAGFDQEEQGVVIKRTVSLFPSLVVTLRWASLHG